MDIRKVLIGAFGYVYEYKVELTKALLFPFIIMILLGLYEPESETINWSYYFVTALGSIFMYVVIAITTHRIILLGPSSVSQWGLYTPTKRELYFLLYGIGIAIIMMPLGLLALIPVIGFPLSVLLFTYVLGRLSLVFPAIAIDRDWTFTDSWNATKHHQITMMIVVVVFPFVIELPEKLLSNLPYTSIFVNIKGKKSK